MSLTFVIYSNTVLKHDNLLKNKWIIFVENSYFALKSALSGLI